MVYGSAVEEPFMENYCEEYKNTGKKQLSKYPLLMEIFQDLEGYSLSNYDENIIFNFAVFLGRTQNAKREETFHNELQSIETTLHLIGFNQMNRKQKRNIAKRIKKFQEVNSIGIYNELNSIAQLSNMGCVSDIKYLGTGNNQNDVQIRINNLPFDIEITSLQIGKVEKLLKDCFRDVCSNFLRLIPEGKSLRIYVKTERLKDGKDFVAEPTNVMLTDAITEIMPLILVQDGYFRLSTIVEKDAPLISVKNLFPYYSEYGERLTNLMKTKEGLKFLTSTPCNAFLKSPIKRVSIDPAKCKIVEIHSEGLYPSTGEELREIYTLSRIRKRVEEKIKNGQLLDKENPLIIMKFNDSNFWSYSDGDYFGYKQFEKVREATQTAFHNQSEKNILGVIFYEEKISRGIFVQNPNSNIKPQILEEIGRILPETPQSPSI